MNKKLFLVLMLLPVLLMGAELRHLNTDASAYPTMQSTVLALDNSGNPLGDLTASNFELSFGGQPVDSLNVRSFEETGTAMSVMLCVDVSNSMKGEPLSSVKKALRELVAAKRSSDEFAIAVYAGTWTMLTDFTTEKDLLDTRINGLTVLAGSTAMYYSAFKSLEQIKRTAGKPFRAMILFGDGKDENQTTAYSEKDVINFAQQEQIPIFTVGYTVVDKQYLQALEHLAKVCGGTFVHAANSSELTAAFSGIARQFMQSKVLSYIPIGLAGDGAIHKLSLILKSSEGNSTTSVEIAIPNGRPAHQGGKPKSALAQKLAKFKLLLIFAGIVILAVALWFIFRPRKKAQISPVLSQPIAPAPPAAKPAPKPKPAPINPERERTVILAPGAKPAPMQSEARLRMEILIGPDAGKVFTINAGGASIGRAADNQIVLSDDAVSSHHAKIYYAQGTFMVEEVRATNGIFINGVKTSQAALKGNTTFKFGASEGAFTLI